MKPDEDALRAERELRLARCEEALGYRFLDRSLLELALTHSSLRDDWTESNERLEFLGDAVVGLVASEHLFCSHPDAPEGELTRLRSLIVSRASLLQVAFGLKIEEHLRVGKGMRAARELPPSLLTNTVEALVGAVYLDAGYERTREILLAWLQRDGSKPRRRDDLSNWKAALQHLVQKQSRTIPTYKVIDESGPDHSKRFVIAAVVGDREFPAARGHSKKQAEQRAAKAALRALQDEAKARGPDGDPLPNA